MTGTTGSIRATACDAERIAIPTVRRLRAFQKVELSRGLLPTVAFTLRPDDLRFVARDGRLILEGFEGDRLHSVWIMEADR